MKAIDYAIGTAMGLAITDVGRHSSKVSILADIVNWPESLLSIVVPGAVLIYVAFQVKKGKP